MRGQVKIGSKLVLHRVCRNFLRKALHGMILTLEALEEVRTLTHEIVEWVAVLE